MHALKPLLDRFGNETRLTIILFTLDETAYSRELAPLAGHYPALKLGPAWWFYDIREGHAALPRADDRDGGLLQHRRLQRRHARLPVDSRPARCGAAHRLRVPRRLVAEHRLDEDEARELGADLAYGLAKSAYGF